MHPRVRPAARVISLGEGGRAVPVEVTDRSGPGVPEPRPPIVMRMAAVDISSSRGLRNGRDGGGAAGGQ
jgi:hypothetical protein